MAQGSYIVGEFDKGILGIWRGGRREAPGQKPLEAGFPSGFLNIPETHIRPFLYSKVKDDKLLAIAIVALHCAFVAMFHSSHFGFCLIFKWQLKDISWQ